MKKILLLVLCSVLIFGFTGCKNTELVSSEVIDSLSETKKIVLQTGSDKEVIKTITDEKEIQELVNIISRADKVSGWVTLEGNNRYMLMYDQDEQLIYTILGWDSGYLGFNEKEYKIKFDDEDRFLQILGI